MTSTRTFPHQSSELENSDPTPTGAVSGLTFPKLAIGLLVSTIGLNACKEKGPDSSQASLPGNKSVESTNPIEVALIQSAALIQSTYARQNESGSLEALAAKKLIDQVCLDVAQVLSPSERTQLPLDLSSPEGRNGLQRLLYAHNYFFNIGVSPDADGNRAFLTCEMGRLSSTPVRFDAPKFELGQIAIPQTHAIPIRELEAVYCSPYEMTPGNRISGTHFVTPGQYLPELDIILLNPIAFGMYTQQSGRDPAIFRESVILNELAHACFERQIADLKNPNEIRVTLDVSSTQILEVDIHQISEAFSDFISLKYGSDLVTLLEERSQANVADYALSEFLFRNGLAAVVNASPQIVPLDQIDTTSFESTALGCVKYFEGNAEASKQARLLIAKQYEALLERLLISISQS